MRRLARMLCLPLPRRRRWLAMCLMVAKFADACPLRMRHSSSRNTMSITQCSPFSTPQWLRIAWPICSASPGKHVRSTAARFRPCPRPVVPAGSPPSRCCAAPASGGPTAPTRCPLSLPPAASPDARGPVTTLMHRVKQSSTPRSTTLTTAPGVHWRTMSPLGRLSIGRAHQDRASNALRASDRVCSVSASSLSRAFRTSEPSNSISASRELSA